MKIVVMYSTHRVSAGHLERLRQLSSEIEIAVVTNELQAQVEIESAEIVLGHRYLRQSVPFARRLRWVQSTAGQCDRLPGAQLAAKQAMLTSGLVPGDMIARHAVTMAWSINRRIPEWAHRQRGGRWDNQVDWLPMPRRAIVFGTGAIGSAIARLLVRDDVQVTGVNRSGSCDDMPEFAEALLLPSALQALSDFDWCFLALPDSGSTRQLFNSQILQRLRRDAVLINVGRASAIVLDDLLDVLQTGHLGGVGLDVLDPVPECADHAVWHQPRLLITPHVSAHSTRRADEIETFCESQVKRYLEKRPLHNRVI